MGCSRRSVFVQAAVTVDTVESSGQKIAYLHDARAAAILCGWLLSLQPLQLQALHAEGAPAVLGICGGVTGASTCMATAKPVCVAADDHAVVCGGASQRAICATHNSKVCSIKRCTVCVMVWRLMSGACVLRLPAASRREWLFGLICAPLGAKARGC